MPMFAYTARDRSGKQVSGTVEANAEREVAGILFEKSLFPVEVKASTGASRRAVGAFLSRDLWPLGGRSSGMAP